MEIFTVAFFGHRRIERSAQVERKLEEIIEKLLSEKEYVDFLVGRNGDFDQLVSSVVRLTKRRLGGENSSLILVLPYLTAECLNNRKNFEEYYDEIELCEKANTAYFKSAVQIRNRYMVERADLSVFYVENDEGGAYQTYQYAKRKKKTTVNIFDCL